MDDLIVETANGKVRGTNLGPVNAWKGIPFAAPPVGPRRFRPPQPPEPWAGVRDATTTGAIAPQLPFMLCNGTLEIAMPEPQSEDCLFLNIWAPPATAKPRPVMVWLHGGAFLNGSGSQKDYDGARFAADGDLVLVTINYRLGALGFLYLEELAGETYAGSGNCGLLDQIAAFKWVQANIAAFGGDPNNVTAFGESAGAISIAMFFGMPTARGLFQRALLESGLPNGLATKDVVTQQTQKYLSCLGLETNALAQLSTIPLEKLLAAQALYIKESRLGSFQPVLDGTNLVETPYQAVAHGLTRDIALLVGTNRDEVRLFTDTVTGEKRASSLGAGAIPPAMRKKLPQILGTYAPNKPALWLGMVRTALKMPDERLADVVSTVITDYAIRLPSIRLAEEQVRQGGRVWMYRFDWRSPLLKFGACHALELPFVWDKLESEGFRVLLGPNPPHDLARKMYAAWIAFGQTGDPNIADLPTWSAYDLDRRATMIFDASAKAVDDPQAKERQVWTGLL